MKRNIIQLSQLEKYNDHKVDAKLQEQFSSFRNWKIDEDEITAKYAYIYVDDSFMIKNVLLTNNYICNRYQGFWYKKLATSVASKEQGFVEQYRHQASFTMVADNSFYICLCI